MRGWFSIGFRVALRMWLREFYRFCGSVVYVHSNFFILLYVIYPVGGNKFGAEQHWAPGSNTLCHRMWKLFETLKGDPKVDHKGEPREPKKDNVDLRLANQVDLRKHHSDRTLAKTEGGFGCTGFGLESQTMDMGAPKMLRA